MNKVIDFKIETVDFDTAVEEVDVIIPRYLESLEELENFENFETMEANLDSVIAYWSCLNNLFDQLRPHSGDVPFDSIIKNTLQAELATLERVYLRINLAIEFSKASWCDALWKSAEKLLDRMDVVLEALDFDEDHKDRLFIQEIQISNMKKYHWWQLKNRLTS